MWPLNKAHPIVAQGKLSEALDIYQQELTSAKKLVDLIRGLRPDNINQRLLKIKWQRSGESGCQFSTLPFIAAL
jgi:hypothetical protein